MEKEDVDSLWLWKGSVLSLLFCGKIYKKCNTLLIWVLDRSNSISYNTVKEGLH